MKSNESTNAVSERAKAQPGLILEMLASLAEAIDAKADQIDDEGDDEGDEIRVKALRDVAAAIKERFVS